MYPKTAVLLAVLPLILTACQSTRVDDTAAKPPKVNTRPSPGINLNPEDQATVDAVWTSYQKLNTIYIKAAQTGVYNWDPDPAKRPMYDYAAGQFLSALERDLDFMSEQESSHGEPR